MRLIRSYLVFAASLFAIICTAPIGFAQTVMDDVVSGAINQTANDVANNTLNSDPTAGDLLLVQAEAAFEADDLPRAIFLFQTACNQGSAESCHRAGEMYDANQGTNGQVDDETAKSWALTYYDGACQLGYAESCPIMQPYYDRHALMCNEGTSAMSCLYIGNSRAYGWPYTGLQAEQAASDYDKACDLGLGVGCSSLGDLYFVGSGVEQSSAEGAAYYELGCRRQHAEVCGVLGGMYQRGEQVLIDGAKALALFQLGCDQQDLASCKSLGYAYWQGDLVAKNRTKAKLLLSPVCDAGDVAVCNDLALLD